MRMFKIVASLLLGYLWLYLVEKTLDSGVWCMPPAWLWSGTRWCCPPAVWRVSCSTALPGHHTPPPIWHAGPPPPPPPPLGVSPAQWQGSSDMFLPWPQHWPTCDPTGAAVWSGACPVPHVQGVPCLGMVRSQNQNETPGLGEIPTLKTFKWHSSIIILYRILCSLPP